MTVLNNKIFILHQNIDMTVLNNAIFINSSKHRHDSTKQKNIH